MLRRFITLAGALTIFAITPATAQQYQLRHYGVSDGLAHGAVHSIYQDRKGYIWFSTREGLSKFDGYTFANFGERDGRGQQFINAVAEDKQGRMWIATNGAGVALFMDEGQVTSGVKFKTFLVNPAKDEGAQPANSVNRILFDLRNTLWALTDGGLYRASLSDPNLNFEAVKTDPLSESQTPAFADSRGNLWFGHGKEVLEIREGEMINHGNVSGQIIQSISQDGDGNIVVGATLQQSRLLPTLIDLLPRLA